MASNRTGALAALLLIATAGAARADGIIDLRITAPGAELYVDDVRRASVPAIEDFRLQLRVPAGTHRIELRRGQRNRYYDMRSTLEVAVPDEAVVRTVPPPLAPVPLPRAAEHVAETVAALLRDLVTVPAGSFFMGTPDEGEVSEYELPRHKVQIARPFLLGRHEVTFDQWDACVADKGCSTAPDDSAWDRGRNPVIHVSWEDTQQFTAWLSRVSGRAFRLPSEAEWEYAARGGNGGTFFFGEDPALLKRFAWFDGERPQPVGTREANPFGLHDMLGNVAEWVQDCWHPNFDGAPDNGDAWMGGKCRVGTVKGGDWHDLPWYLRPAHRTGVMRRNHYNYIGFRIAQ